MDYQQLEKKVLAMEEVVSHLHKKMSLQKHCLELIENICLFEPVTKLTENIYKIAHVGVGQCEHKDWEKEVKEAKLI